MRAQWPAQGWPKDAWTVGRQHAFVHSTLLWVCFHIGQDVLPSQGGRGTLRQPHHSPPFPQRLQGLLTLFTEFFASFDCSTCVLSVPGLYASLPWIHMALQTAVPSHSTPGCTLAQRSDVPRHTLWCWTITITCGSFQSPLPGARDRSEVHPAAPSAHSMMIA